jgi:ribosomal protein L1
MLSSSDEIVPVPHPFKQNEKRTILAFAADAETQEAALEAGAETSLGADSIKKIVKGQFRIDDYDFCVAHSNMQGIINPLRGILRSRFPTQINGVLILMNAYDIF